MDEATYGRKSLFLPTPPAFNIPVTRGSRRDIAVMFSMEKLEWRGYPTVKKFEDVFFIRFNRLTDTARGRGHAYAQHHMTKM